MSVKYRKLRIVEACIGFEFTNKDLALRALRHSSFGDGRREFENNERLEFLGCLLYTSDAADE